MSMREKAQYEASRNTQKTRPDRYSETYREKKREIEVSRRELSKLKGFARGEIVMDDYEEKNTAKRVYAGPEGWQIRLYLF